MKLAHCILLIAAALVLSSCKIRIVVPEGGSVTTQSGAYSCASGKTCNIDVVDFYFDQKFVARPASGYKFKFWKKADRRFCGQDTKPCRVTTVGTGVNEDLAKVMMSFFESNEVFYLQPVFERVSENALTVAGSWSGAAADSSGPGRMNWTLTQTGSLISGTMTATDGHVRLGIRGTVSGTISGSTVSFTFAIPPGGFQDSRYANCSARLSGTATVSGPSLIGNYSGTNSCTGPVYNGTLDLRRQ